MKASIGIAIPNYNNSKYLEECIGSISTQTYKNIKILVVDDCSTDNSVEILQKLERKYEKFNFVINDTNHGVAYTRDRAIRLLDTEYVTAIDSDDFYYTIYKIENEMRLIDKYRKKGKEVVAYSNIINTDSDGKFLKRSITKYNLCNGECFEEFITRSARIPTCSIFSKKLFEQIDGFDTRIDLYEDWDFKIRLSKIAEFYYTNEDGFAYRHHNMGLSSRIKEEHIKWINYVFNKNSNNLQNKYELERKLYKNLNPNIIRKFIRKITI